MFSGIPGTAGYLDNIIIMGRSSAEMQDRVCAVLERVREYGFLLRTDKCHFFLDSIKYFVFVFDVTDRHPDPENTRAIHRMPAPKNVLQFRSFLGLISYYSAFLPSLHDVRATDAPLCWFSDCEKAFAQLKSMLSSNLLLTHYDLTLPIVVAADASNNGVRAVISHAFPDGSEKAITHASRTLTVSEKNYEQMEEEALALVFAIKTLHKLLCDRHFTLLTDYKPFLLMFVSDTGIPVSSSSRLRRWANILLGYDFGICYCCTIDFGQADAHFRLICSHEEPEEDTAIVAISTEEDLLRQLSDSIPDIRRATEQDPVFRQAITYVQTCWSTTVFTSNLQQFFLRRALLSVLCLDLMKNCNKLRAFSPQARSCGKTPQTDKLPSMGPSNDQENIPPVDSDEKTISPIVAKRDDYMIKTEPEDQIKGPVVCAICCEQFPSPSAVEDHVKSVHEGNCPYSCSLCRESFSSPQTLRIHCKTKHNPQTGDGDVQCELCKQRFPFKYELRAHMRAKHCDFRQFECSFCAAKFKTVYHIQVHILGVHEGWRPVKCNLCNGSFQSRNVLGIHIRTVHQKLRPFKCPYCSKQFGQKSSVGFHIRTYHDSSKKFKCDVCAFTFSREATLSAHIKRSHENVKKYACSKCGKDYTSETSLEDHIKFFHADSFLSVCPICSKTFSVPELLEYHILGAHEGVRRFECPHCDRKFSEKCHLTIHLKTHEAGNYQCVICHEKFRDANNLWKHMQASHDDQPAEPGGPSSEKTSQENRRLAQPSTRPAWRTKVKTDAAAAAAATTTTTTSRTPPPHQWGDVRRPIAFYHHYQNRHLQRCGLGSSLSSVRRVWLAQTGPSAIASDPASGRFDSVRTPGSDSFLSVCPICSKTFSVPELLEYHILGAHEGVRRFECPHCDRRFSEKCHLTIHLKTHEAGNYQCVICHEKFRDANNLWKHMQASHDGARPFTCDLCPCAFTRPNNLRHHIERDHSGLPKRRKYRRRILPPRPDNIQPLKERHVENSSNS
nr:unnamed protein product [Spirometra erinaceieuropaei]